jgi:hypothetical protein
VGFSTKRHPTLASDLDIFLGDLCREWGICNSLNGESIIRSQGKKLTAKNFAMLVLRAEGMSADDGAAFVEEITQAFRVRYGENIETSNWTPPIIS